MAVKCVFECGVIPWERDESRGITRWALLHHRFAWDGEHVFLVGPGEPVPLFKVLVFELAMQFSVGYVAGRESNLFSADVIQIGG